MAQKLKMSDIAKMAGVSKTTVSRYFNGGYVKEETREKLREIIEKYNYEPNSLAAGLKAKQTHIVGIVCACLDSYTSSRMMMSIDDRLHHSHHYTTVILNTNHDELRELTALEQLWRMNVDGIILMATHITMAHHKIASKLDIPMIFVAQSYEDGISVINDDYNAGYQMGTYVANCNHRDVVYMGVEQKDVAVGVVRKSGVYNGLEDHGVSHIKFVESDFSAEKARRRIARILDQHMPTCIICATDTMALACYRELVSRGLKVPDDVSLAGFGGYWVSETMEPALTTIRFKYDEVGRIAADEMIHLIAHEQVEKAMLVGYEFIKGESVKVMS